MIMPELIIVAPLKVLFPLSVSKDVLFWTSPPVPLITPEKVFLPLARVRVPDPKVTEPAPERELMVSLKLARFNVELQVRTHVSGMTLAAPRITLALVPLMVIGPVQALPVLDKVTCPEVMLNLPPPVLVMGLSKFIVTVDELGAIEPPLAVREIDLPAEPQALMSALRMPPSRVMKSDLSAPEPKRFGDEKRDVPCLRMNLVTFPRELLKMIVPAPVLVIVPAYRPLREELPVAGPCRVELVPKVMVLAPLIVQLGQVPGVCSILSVPFMVMLAPSRMEPKDAPEADSVALSLLALFHTVVKGPEVEVPHRARVVFQVPGLPLTTVPLADQ